MFIKNFLPLWDPNFLFTSHLVYRGFVIYIIIPILPFNQVFNKIYVDVIFIALPPNRTECILEIFIGFDKHEKYKMELTDINQYPRFLM